MSNVTEMVVISRTNPAIEFNYEEAEKYLEGLLKDFSNWQIQESDLSFAKDTLVGLNKLTKSVEDFRKTNKKELEKPIKEFEEKCKRLTSKISEVYNPLKIQYDGFEEKRRIEKLKELELLLEQVKNDSNLPSEYQQKLELKDFYANKTTAQKQILEDLWQQINVFVLEIKEIQEKKELINILCESNSIKYKLQMRLDVENFINIEKENLKEVIESAAKRQKENEIAAIETIKKNEEWKATEKIQEAVKNVEKFIPIEKNVTEKELTTTLKIFGSKSQLVALKEYMSASGIKYERIE